MIKKILTAIIVVMILAIAGALYYWYFYILHPNYAAPAHISNETEEFTPFGNTPPVDTATVSTTTIETTGTTTPEVATTYQAPKLRQITTTLVAGFVASTSAVRYIDRGTGHIYEVLLNDAKTSKLSNTTLPKIYEAYGNKQGTNFIIRYLKEDTDIITNFFAQLQTTGTSTTETPFQIKGKYVSGDINEIAVSPLGDKVFTWNIEGGKGVGYISAFDEKGKIKIIDTPLTQVRIDWPEISTLTLATKASSVATGYVYIINSKNGSMKNILGGMKGLSGKVSRDAKQVIYSMTTDANFATSLKNLKDGIVEEVVFKTLIDKCVWSALRTNEIYCAVPTEIPDGQYPDDWYKGTVSFTDQIWHLDTTTGEVHLIEKPLQSSNVLMDATNLTLDPKENTLYFINKRDLTLWALDLTQ